MTHSRPGWIPALVLLIGCASPTPGIRGYDGVVLQDTMTDPTEPGPGRGPGWLTPVWVPWRATFGAVGFVLSGDPDWFSPEVSPWTIEAGHYPLWEDVYGPEEIP